MTNAPGNGWPGGPPPQGPGSAPSSWGAQPGNATGQPGNPYTSPNPQYPRQYPDQQYRSQGPARSQPPQSTSGFDPTRALGEASPQSVSINQFKPPSPNRTPVLVTVVALVALVLVIATGTYLRSQPATPSPSPSASQSTPTGPGQPFTTPNGQQSGRWQILDQQWIDEGLQLHLRIYSDNGPITFSFLAFANASTEVVDPRSSPMSPDIRTGTASPSAPITGYVFFPMSREDATIILATGSGRQMSALVVKG